jgi:hypothetical protein
MYQVTEIKMFRVCRRNGRQCNTEENDKKETVFQREKRRCGMRWLDDVEGDLKKMTVKGWKEKRRDREQWKLAVEEGKAHPGL